MSKEFQLTFRSDDDDASASDMSNLQRMMNLAGIATTQPEQGCESCGDQDHMSASCPHSSNDEDMESLGEEQAEFDHGSQDIESDGHEVNPNTYMWQASKLPQRIVKGTQGDNPLISEIHNRLLEQYDAFLTETESRENEDGSLSPLSDPTKPEFDKDPLSGVEPVDDGSRSPMSTIVRQAALK